MIGLPTAVISTIRSGSIPASAASDATRPETASRIAAAEASSTTKAPPSVRRSNCGPYLACRCGVTLHSRGVAEIWLLAVERSQTKHNPSGAAVQAAAAAREEELLALLDAEATRAATREASRQAKRVAREAARHQKTLDRLATDDAFFRAFTPGCVQHWWCEDV